MYFILRKITIFHVFKQKNNPLKSQRVINKMPYWTLLLLFCWKLVR